MRKILVTGGTGFIGSQLVKELLDDSNYSVAILVRNYDKVDSSIKNKVEVFVYDGSFSSVEYSFKIFNPDTVIHLATLFISLHSKEVLNKLIDSNVRYGLYILESMVSVNCKMLINTGTAWQHFQNQEYNPVNLYASTKQAFEDIARYYHEAYNISIINLHLFDTYGPNDTRPKLLSLLKEIQISGNTLDMTCGDQEINLTHLFDIVGSFRIAIDLLNNNDVKFETFSVKSSETLTIKKLVELIENVTMKKMKINWCKRPYRKREIMKIWDGRRVLPGWEEKVILKDGILEYFNS